MKNFLINAIIFLLVFAGSILVGWHFIEDDVMNFLMQVEIVPEEFEQNLIDSENELLAESDADDIEDLFNWDNVTHLEFADVINYMNYVDLVSPVGELILPTIDVRLPILIGPTDLNMTLGAGTVVPGMVMGQGNFVLGSHNASATNVRFGGLHLIELGDMIIMRDANYIYVYETVIANYVVHQSRLDIVDEVEGKIYITLFTCTNVTNSDYRIVVRGEFVEQIAIAQIVESIELYNNLNELAANLSESLSEVIDVEEVLETIVEIVENLDNTNIPFPVLQASLTVGGSILLASFAVWISGKDFKKKKNETENETEA